ncbi:MAG: ABC transporter permease [Chromatiales bacterium]|nr:ABC transporter permease [Chromatiales bacterium]
MTEFIIRRLLQSSLVVLVMISLVFVGVYVIGNPVDVLIDQDAEKVDFERMVAMLGLDRPLWEQFLVYVGNLLTGEMGRSFAYGEPALRLVVERIPATLELVTVAVMLSLVVAVPLGMWAGLYPERKSTRAVMGMSIVGVSIPNFWQGLMLILLFAVLLDWLPSGGRGDVATVFGIESSLWTLDGWAHLILPATNLALFNMTLVIRLLRASVREIVLLDYIKFAHAKGLRRARIICVHVFKNTLVVLITVLGLEVGSLIAYSVITETIFSWPGMGKLIIDSIYILDRPVIVAYLIVVVMMFILINLIVDIAYSLIDPRIRLGSAGGARRE